MSGYSPEIEQAGITWGQLKKCRDDDYDMYYGFGVYAGASTGQSPWCTSHSTSWLLVCDIRLHAWGC